MKKFLAVMVAAFIIFGVAAAAVQAAEEGEKEKVLTGELGFSFYNKYVGATDGQVYFNKPVIHGSLLVSHEPTGIYVELWSSYSPKGGFNSDEGDEVDPFRLGIEHEISGLTIDAGYSYYNLHNLKHTAGDLHALYINVDFPKIYKVTPYINLEADIPTDREILEGGFLYKAGLKYILNLGHPIDLNLSVSGHDGAYGAEPELISSDNLKVSSTFAVLGVEVTPEINLQKRIGKKVEDGGLTQNIVWYGVSILYSFDIL